MSEGYLLTAYTNMNLVYKQWRVEKYTEEMIESYMCSFPNRVNRIKIEEILESGNIRTYQLQATCVAMDRTFDWDYTPAEREESCHIAI